MARRAFHTWVAERRKQIANGKVFARRFELLERSVVLGRRVPTGAVIGGIPQLSAKMKVHHTSAFFVRWHSRFIVIPRMILLRLLLPRLRTCRHSRVAAGLRVSLRALLPRMFFLLLLLKNARV